MKISLRFFLVLVTLAVFAAVYLLEPYVQRKRVERAVERMQKDLQSVEVVFNQAGRASNLICTGKGNSPMRSSYDVTSKFDVSELPKLKYLDSLELQFCIVDKISPLEKLRNLKALWLIKCQVDFTEADQPWQIESLYIDRTKIPLHSPTMPKLKSLTIKRSGLGMGFTPSDSNDKPEGFDFRPFQNWHSLEDIQVSDEFITDFHGLQYLERLSLIKLRDCHIYSIDGVEYIESLKHLDISSRWRRPMLELDIEKLCRCKSLKTLVLPRTMSETNYDLLKASLPDCEIRPRSAVFNFQEELLDALSSELN